MTFSLSFKYTRTRGVRAPGRTRLGTPLAAATMIALAASFGVGETAHAASVRGSISALERSGAIDHDLALAARRTYRDARVVRRRTTGSSRRAMSYQIRTVERLARANRITGDRVRPLFETLRRNTDWFRKNGPRPAGTDRRFGDSRIIFQYFAGQGWQFHPLSNFAKLNAVWTVKTKPARRALGKYAHELLGWAVNRGGALTWEYYFPFSGSRAPFISSISQGTAIQALARAGNALDDSALTVASQQAALAFGLRAPVGLKVARETGNHYLGYSGNRRLLILNMFIKSLDSLHDHSVITGDQRSWDLYREGLKGARRDTVDSDTGAWSLYSVSGAESSLHYHQLLTGFLKELCGETKEDVFCQTRANFAAYVTQRPRLTKIKATASRRRVMVRFRLSKISKVSVIATRMGRTAAGSSATVGYGKRRFSFRKPRKKGLYRIKIVAVDLAGNRTTKTVKIRIRR